MIPSQHMRLTCPVKVKKKNNWKKAVGGDEGKEMCQASCYEDFLMNLVSVFSCVILQHAAILALWSLE